MADKYTGALKTLLKHMGNQTECLHAWAPQTVSIPVVWRTPRQRSEFGERWAGLQEPEQAREIGFLDALRRELRATGLLRLALTPESQYPHLLAAVPEVNGAREDGTLAQKVVSQVRDWPSSELRKAAGIASELGSGSPLDSALIRFPSPAFPELPHKGIETVVLAFFPEDGERRSLAYRQVFVIINGGISELGSYRSLKTQHENLTRHVIYNLRKDAEDAWGESRSRLKQLDAAADPTLVLESLRQQAEAARDCGRRLPMTWGSSLLDAATHEFASGAGQFLSLWSDEHSEAAFATARQRLVELGAWLAGATWLDMLLVENGTQTRRAGMILTNVIADISGLEPPTDPITLDSIAAALVRRLGPPPSSVGALNEADIRGLLHKHLEPWYCEQNGTATVLETYRSRARIEVRGEDEGGVFRTSIPLASLPGRPREGDRYELVVWDLWHHWFGITAVKRSGSAIRKWTAEKRRKFEEGLENIKCGPAIERRGRS